jgi:hypothetical protein
MTLKDAKLDMLNTRVLRELGKPLDSLETPQEYHRALRIVGQEGPLVMIFWDTHQKLTKELLALLLLDAWRSTEEPEKDAPAPRWRAWFRRAGGFLSDGKERPSGSDLKIVYRGCAHGQERGMSWTDQQTVAEVIARRRDKNNGIVYEASVRPGSIMATFETRGGLEILIYPDDLIDVKKCAESR